MMEIDVNWFAVLGFAFGLAAFLRWIFHDIADYINRPKLVISHGPFTVDWQSLETQETRRFVHLEVVSRKGRVARKCVAKAIVLRHPADVTVLDEEFSLHWADTPYSTVSTEAEPVDIGAKAKRLDIAFTVSQYSGQSWLATPLALAVPQKSPQAALPPGEYVVQVTVSCEDGKGDAKTFKLISPRDWQDLQADDLGE